MRAAIASIILDFDGLIVDTETPIFDAWLSAYARQGQPLGLDEWIPVGVLADTLGPRRLLSGGSLVAGLGSLAFALAPTWEIAAAGRTLVGVGVSVAFIAILKVSAVWFPANRFATLNGVTMFAGNLGAVIAGAPLAWLVAQASWRSVFVGLAVLSTALGFATWWKVRDRPEDAGFAPVRAPATATATPTHWVHALRSVLANPATWPGFFVNAGVAGSYLAFAGLWAVPYLVEVYGMPCVVAAQHASILLLGVAFGSLVVGIVLRRSFPLWRIDTQCFSPANPTLDQAQTAGLSRFVPQHAAGMWGVDPYTARSVATTGLSLCIDPADHAACPPAELAARIAEVRELRDCWLGDFHALTPITVDDGRWMAWQLNRSDLGRGFALAFRRPQAGNQTIWSLGLRDLDPHGLYCVRHHDAGWIREMTGAELASLSVTLPQPGSCALISYRACTAPIRQETGMFALHSPEIAGARKESWTVETEDTRLTVGVTHAGQLVVYELSNPSAGWNWTADPFRHGPNLPQPRTFIKLRH